MKKYMFSVIVPVYNVEKFLVKCLDSVVNQTYRNLEIILVDDGSPDNSPVICDEYAARDGRIKVIHQKNAGQAAARNVGISVAKGDYITFVDSDDWIEPEMYEKLYAALVQKQADIAVTGYFLETKSESKTVSVEEKRYGTPVNFLEGTILDKNAAISAVWSKLYKRQIFDTVRFVPDIRCEDNICMVDLFGKNPKVAFAEGYFYHYNKLNAQSVTCQVESKMEYGYFVFLSKYLQLPFEFLENKVVLGQVKADILKHAVRCYIENLAEPQMSEERLAEIDKFLRDEKNYIGADKLKLRHRILCWSYRHCKVLLYLYARIRY